MKRALAIALGCALTGCLPRSVEWSYHIASDIDADAVGIQAYLREPIDGGDPCDRADGQSRQLVTYAFLRGEDSPVAPRQLEPGIWGLEMDALDADCEPIGRGCTEIEVPDDMLEMVLVEIEMIPIEASECPLECANGFCDFTSDAP